MNGVLIGSNSNPNNYKVLVNGTASFNNNVFYTNGSIDLINGSINIDPYGTINFFGNPRIQFNSGNYISIDNYGVNATGYPYLFLGDYKDANNGNTIFIDDSANLVKFGNFNSGFGGDGTNPYNGSDMAVKAQINTQDGSGYLASNFLNWDGGGSFTFNSGWGLIVSGYGVDTNAGYGYFGDFMNDNLATVIMVDSVSNYINFGNVYGVDYTNPTTMTIVGQINGADGSGFLSNNNIAWDIYGNLTINNLVSPNIETLNYVNDAAAAVGGVPVGGFYNTAGVLKIRLT